MSISYHKNGLVRSYQSVGKWLIFHVFCSKNILTKLIDYQQPTCLCVKMEFVVGSGPISLSCAMHSVSWSCFRSCGSAKLCMENDVSFYMCSAAEVAWLAQNI